MAWKASWCLCEPDLKAASALSASFALMLLFQCEQSVARISPGVTWCQCSPSHLGHGFNVEASFVHRLLSLDTICILCSKLLWLISAVRIALCPQYIYQHSCPLSPGTCRTLSHPNRYLDIACYLTLFPSHKKRFSSAALCHSDAL